MVKVVLDRFKGKPLTVTVSRDGKGRVYTGKNAQTWAKFFGLSDKQTFRVIPNAGGGQ